MRALLLNRLLWELDQRSAVTEELTNVVVCVQRLAHRGGCYFNGVSLDCLAWGVVVEVQEVLVAIASLLVEPLLNVGGTHLWAVVLGLVDHLIKYSSRWSVTLLPGCLLLTSLLKRTWLLSIGVVRFLVRRKLGSLLNVEHALSSINLLDAGFLLSHDGGHYARDLVFHF